MYSLREAVSRRNLLCAAALGLGGLAAIAPAALRWYTPTKKQTSWWQAQSLSLAHAGIDQWSRQIGLVFMARSEAGLTQLKLLAVKPLPSAGIRPKSVSRTQAFAATFEKRGGVALAGDRTYTVQNPKFGEMSVFFGALGPGDRLEAVFN